MSLLETVAALILGFGSVLILRTTWLLDRETPVVEPPRAAEEQHDWREAA